MALKTVYDEAHLLRELKSGSEPAFEQLYRRYSKQIFSNTLHMVRCQETSQEILQEVFIKVWEHRGTLDPELSFRSYLFRIAHNKVFNYFRSEQVARKVKAYLESTETELYSHIEESIHSEEQSQMLHQMIDRLPSQRKIVYRLCKLEGKSYEEVSMMLNISTSTISDHIVKANRFVKEHFPSREAYGSIALASLLFGNL